MNSPISPKISAELGPGESVLWHESPSPVAHCLGKKGFLAVAIGLLVGGVFCWVGLSGPPGPGWLFAAFGTVAVGSVVYELLAGIWTSYAVTNRRLLILHPSVFSTVVESYYPPDIDFVKKYRKRNGNGSLVFSALREKSGKRVQTVEIGFFGIRDVDQVESKVIALRIPANGQRQV